MVEEQGIEICDQHELDSNLVYEVLRRVDGVTLATSSCVSSVFCGISQDEGLWEHLCTSRWPSTREPDVKSLISSIGGFRQFYKECYPLILSGDPISEDEEANSAEFWWDSDEEDSEVPVDRSPSHLISVVDVVFDGQPVLSRVIEGIPGASDYLGWFSNCPFRMDILKAFDEDEDRESQSEFAMSNNKLPFVESLEKEKKEGKLWKALWEGLRVSWIVIDKRTKQLANLTSWKPIMGQRHWPTDEGFFLRFGSILPASIMTSSAQSVQCNIVVKCKFSNSAAQGVSLKLTELSMQLEDMGGLHLNGRESLAVLYKALKSDRSKKHTEVMHSCLRYLKVQSELREKKLKHEDQRDTYTVLGFIGAVIWLSYSIISLA